MSRKVCVDKNTEKNYNNSMKIVIIKYASVKTGVKTKILCRKSLKDALDYFYRYYGYKILDAGEFE